MRRTEHSYFSYLLIALATAILALDYSQVIKLTSNIVDFDYFAVFDLVLELTSSIVVILGSNKRTRLTKHRINKN